MMEKTWLDATKNTYLSNYNSFMRDWAESVRKWTNCKNAIFYKDGIFDVNEWFNNKEFRPLFILKEVHESNIDDSKKEASNHSENEIAKYGKTQAIENCVDFVATGTKYGSDPWNGKGIWKRLGALAVAMYKLHCDNEITDYDNTNKIMDEKCENGESLRQTICRKIAIINLKKLGGGNATESDKSKSTLHFMHHAEYFNEKLIEQISFIQPTVIICCGKGSVLKSLKLNSFDKSTHPYIEIIRSNETKQKIGVIDGHHPSNQTGTEKFYYKTLQELANRKLLITKD